MMRTEGIYFTKVLVPKNSGFSSNETATLIQTFIPDNAKRLLFRAEDIPQLVNDLIQSGENTVGFTGRDLYLEYALANPQTTVQIMQSMPIVNETDVFQKPTLCLIGYAEKEMPLKIRVAINQKYARLSQLFLETLRRDKIIVDTMVVNGQTEKLVREGMADYCVEIVKSGQTIQELGLSVIMPFLASDLVMIGQKEAAGTIPQLYQTILDRLQHSTSGSYTRQVVEKGLFLKKFNEECFEFEEAVLSRQKEKIAWEAADVLYFLNVALAASGVSWIAVETELTRRAAQKDVEKTESRFVLKRNEEMNTI